MKLSSYWLDTAPAFSAAAQDDLVGRTDVAIIGAGYTGLSAALSFARTGASVVVLEAGRVIGQSSGRNGGQCNSGLAHDYAGLAAAIGAERARAYYRVHCDAVDTVESLAREENIDCDFKRCGRIKLAAKPKHFAKLARAFEVVSKEVDPNLILVPPEKIGEEVSSIAFHGGLVQTTSAQLHVGKFGVGLAAAASARGARIYENAEAQSIDRTGRGWRIGTPRGAVEAERVLIATGGASRAGPFGWYRRRIVSVGSFVIATEPLDDGVIERLLPKRRNYVTSKHVGNYFRLSPDNRLIFGGRAQFALSNSRTDKQSGRLLQKKMIMFFPELKDVRIDYSWGGIVDMTADRLPRAGEHDGIHYAMGYSGHGVQMSVHMGRIMAEVMAGRPDANPLRELDWPAIPGHFGKAWFLPFVGAYYRLQDILH